MPGRDRKLDELKVYTGTTRAPADFKAFRSEALAMAAEQKTHVQLQRLASLNRSAEYFRVTITAPDGTELRAVYITPAGTGKVPTVLQFHDYPGSARGLFHLSRYPAIGMAVLAPDCRGQGGESGCGPSSKGPMAYGPLFNGLEGSTGDMYLYKLFTDAMLWAQTALQLPRTDTSRLYTYGEGQGAGLALVCASMYPDAFKKLAMHYAMLCDYRRVWDLDFDTGAYFGLNFFCRWHDPLGERFDEIFGRLDYFDIVNYAPYVKADTLQSICLMDTVSPPSAQFAVYNALNCPKNVLVYPKHGHELNNFFEDRLLAFLLG